MRGKDIKRYHYEFADHWLIATHNGYKTEDGFPVPPLDIRDYPAVKAHLDKYWDDIAPRADQGVTPYNLRNCAYWEDFSQPKIVWQELSRTGNAFATDLQGSVVLNTAYILVFQQAQVSQEVFSNAYAAFLNSSPVLFYLDKHTSRLDKTGWRWLKQYVELIPVPVFCAEALEKLSELYVAASQAKASAAATVQYDRKINNVLYEYFNFSSEEIEILKHFELA